jgi:hypothetical protein
MQSKLQKVGLRFMHTYNVSSFFSFFLLCVFCDSVVSSSSAASTPWLTDWQEGQKAALASGKPLFVVFRCEH